MKTQQTIKLAISFLEELGDRYEDDSCNERFLDVTGDNMTIAQEIAKKCGEDVHMITHKNKKMIFLFDSDLLNLCIDKLKELMLSKKIAQSPKKAVLQGRISSIQNIGGRCLIELRDGSNVRAPLGTMERLLLLSDVSHTVALLGKKIFYTVDGKGILKEIKAVGHIRRSAPLSLPA